MSSFLKPAPPIQPISYKRKFLDFMCSICSMCSKPNEIRGLRWNTYLSGYVLCVLAFGGNTVPFWCLGVHRSHRPQSGRVKSESEEHDRSRPEASLEEVCFRPSMRQVCKARLGLPGIACSQTVEALERAAGILWNS